MYLYKRINNIPKNGSKKTYSKRNISLNPHYYSARKLGYPKSVKETISDMFSLGGTKNKCIFTLATILNTALPAAVIA